MIPEQDDAHLEEGDERATPMDFSSGDAFTTDSGPTSMRRVDRNGVVLFVILVTAVAGLWSMRTLRDGSAAMPVPGSLPQRLRVEPIHVDVMRRLAIPDSSGLALHANRDPFLAWRPAAVSREGSLVERIITDPPPDRETLCADWQGEVEDTAALLRLKSVLGGGTTRALVNIEGVLLAVGDTFDIARTDLEFSVVSAARRSVVLGCYNAELDCWHEATLVMGSGE